MITNNVTTGVHIDSAATAAGPDGGDSVVRGLDTVRVIREANPAWSHTKKVVRNLVSLSCVSFLI